MGKWGFGSWCGREHPGGLELLLRALWDRRTQHAGGGNVAGWSPVPVGLAVPDSQRPWTWQSSWGWRFWWHYLWSTHTNCGANGLKEAMSRSCSIKEGSWGTGAYSQRLWGWGRAVQAHVAQNKGQPENMLEWVEGVTETPMTVEAGSLWLPAARRLFLHLQVSLTRCRTIVPRKGKQTMPRRHLGQQGWICRLETVPPGEGNRWLCSEPPFFSQPRHSPEKLTCQCYLPEAKNCYVLERLPRGILPTTTPCCSSIWAPTILSRETLSVLGVTTEFQGPR